VQLGYEQLLSVLRLLPTEAVLSTATCRAFWAGASSDVLWAAIRPPPAPLKAVLTFATTCRVFRALASSHALWVVLCRRDWGARTAAVPEDLHRCR